MSISFRTWSTRAADLDPETEINVYFDTSPLDNDKLKGFVRYELTMLAGEWERCGRRLEALEEEANRTGRWAPVRKFLREMVTKY